MRFAKKIIFALSLIFCFFPAVFCASVAIVANPGIKTASDAVNGFKSGVKASSGTVTFTMIEPAVAGDADFSAYDLIFVAAPEKLKTVMRKTTKPIVFAMVFDPVEKGVVSSLGPSGKNITGVSLDVSAQYQAKMIKDILPAAKTVGVFYSDKTAYLIVKSREVFKEEGLELKDTSVQSFSQIPPLVAALKGSIDVFWCLPDVRLYTPESIVYILKNFTDNRVPVFGFSESVTKAGALFSYAYDFEDVGKQAGEIGAQILGGTDAGTIPIASPRKMKYTFNNKIKELLNISVPAGAWSQAAEIF